MKKYKLTILIGLAAAISSCASHSIIYNVTEKETGCKSDKIEDYKIINKKNNLKLQKGYFLNWEVTCNNKKYECSTFVSDHIGGSKCEIKK